MKQSRIHSVIRQGIMDAFHRALRKSYFHDITVEDITATADVSRTTFYRYFQDIYDLAGESFDACFREHVPSGDVPSLRDAFSILTSLVHDNALPCRHVISDMDQPTLRRTYAGRMEKLLIPSYRREVLAVEEKYGIIIPMDERATFLLTAYVEAWAGFSIRYVYGGGKEDAPSKALFPALLDVTLEPALKSLAVEEGTVAEVTWPQLGGLRMPEPDMPGPSHMDTGRQEDGTDC